MFQEMNFIYTLPDFIYLQIDINIQATSHMNIRHSQIHLKRRFFAFVNFSWLSLIHLDRDSNETRQISKLKMRLNSTILQWDYSSTIDLIVVWREKLCVILWHKLVDVFLRVLCYSNRYISSMNSNFDLSIELILLWRVLVEERFPWIS